MRKRTKIVLCTIVLCLLSGCSISYKRDYTKDYKSYLTYSLGEYSILKK